MKLRTIKNKFPIYFDNYKISALSVKDIDGYITEIKQEYFNEFLDNKTALSISIDKARNILIGNVNAYNSKDRQFDIAIRTVIKQNNTIIGGISIYPIKNKSIEIAYWLNPIYQGKGIASGALLRIIEFLFKLSKDIDIIKVDIQSRNIKSVKLVDRLGFKYYSSYDGLECTNLIYILRRDVYERHSI